MWPYQNEKVNREVLHINIAATGLIQENIANVVVTVPIQHSEG